MQTGKVETDSRDVFNKTCLQWAVENKHKGVVRLLLNNDVFDTVNSDDDEAAGKDEGNQAEDNADQVVGEALEGEVNLTESTDDGVGEDAEDDMEDGPLLWDHMASW